VAAFNESPEGRLIPFEFSNYRNYPQKSEARVAVVQSDCFASVTKRFFKVKRSNGAPIEFLIAFEALGNDEYRVFAESSNCERVFYEFTKPRMEASGVVFNDQFNRMFTDNNRYEYCPKFESAVQNQLIEVVKSLQ
jgi:hypothetical protein